MCRWNFKEIEPGTPERNPREAEFFNRLSRLAEPVVREFIQNALDARKRDADAVRIRIALKEVSEETDISFIRSELLSDDFIRHVQAAGVYNEKDLPDRGLRFLILEDYGTIGLEGDTDGQARGGNFYNFWWREGISEKKEEKAGRWGLGKTTFHMASRLNTFWGLTLRQSDKRALLMGKALLRVHSLDGKRYQYFSYFTKKYGDYAPIEDRSFLERFRIAIGIKRNIDTNNGETGLSLVIPLPPDEINYDSICLAVIRHYFYPILAGYLRVEIAGYAQQEKEINKDNLIHLATALRWDDTEWEDLAGNLGDILSFVRETIERTDRSESIYILNPAPSAGRIDISAFEGAEISLKAIQSDFQAEKLLLFRVPVTIRKKADPPVHSHFMVSIRKFPRERFPQIKKAFECYIRSGILVSDIRKLGDRQVGALLIVEDPPLSEFLGDCETPAHTEWNERTEGFSKKYDDHAGTLRFVKNALLNIVNLIDIPPEEKKLDFLQDVFYVFPEEEMPSTLDPGQSVAEQSPLSDKGRGDSIKKPAIPEHDSSQDFHIEVIQQEEKGGFRITLSDKKRPGGENIRICVYVAYDLLRHSDPFREYSINDFDLQSKEFRVKAEGCHIQKQEKNRLDVEIKDTQKFFLEVVGFDPRRDIVVKVEKI